LAVGADGTAQRQSDFDVNDNLKFDTGQAVTEGRARPVIEIVVTEGKPRLVSTFSLFDGTLNRLFEVVPESGSGVLLERTGTGTGNRLSGGI
jgi:hypothetical protein